MEYAEQWIYTGLGIIRSVARRYSHNPEEADEFASVGNSAVAHALPKFRGDSESMFYRFTRKVARNAIISAQRKERNSRKNQSIDGLLLDIEDSHSRSPVDLAHENDVYSRIRMLVRYLSFKERTVLRCLYLQGLNAAETSRVICCSSHGVATCHDRALRKLRRGLQDPVIK